jgi:hypothetical protein
LTVSSLLLCICRQISKMLKMPLVLLLTSCKQ